MLTIKKLHIFALAVHGRGISGGDRIFIELARQWSKKFSIQIYLWTEGRRMCRRQKLESRSIKYHVSGIKLWCNFGFVICYLARVVEGIRLGLTLKLQNEASTYIYNASEFWMDSLPCVFLKIRFPQIKWIATWYQTAPNPFIGYKEVERQKSYNFSALLYWLAQLPIKPLTRKFSDQVIVNNEEERQQFSKMDKKGKVIVLIGAVPLSGIKKYQTSNIKHQALIYDAVFQGRFHPQKGVVELIDIWKIVVDKIPNAKLAMIGDGPLMKSVKQKVKSQELEKHVKLFGYVFDGPKKYKIFSQSKVVVHPAFYDSGGMASAEAMAFGLPCVGFNLRSYESYYPKGVVKVKISDEEAFAKEILSLLNNTSRREKIGNEAKKMINANYSWEKRAGEIFNKIVN